MAKGKRLIILAAVLVVLVIATFAVSLIETHIDNIKNSDEIILEIPTDSVTALSWETDSVSLSFHRDDGWIYDGDEAFPVSDESIEALLEQFESFGVTFAIEDVSDFSQYGLDDPVCTINISSESGDYTITLGDYSTLDSERYVSIGDGGAYLVSHDPMEDFDIALDDLILNDTLPYLGAAESLTAVGAENISIIYSEDNGNTYRDSDVYFTADKNLPLDTSLVTSYLSTLTSISLDDYYTYNVTAAELADSGLGVPDLAVTVSYSETAEDGEQTESGEFTLNISRSPDEADAELEDVTTAYCRVGDSQIIYNLSAYDYKSLMLVSYNDLRHKEVLPAEFEDVSSFDVTLDSESYTLTSEFNTNDNTTSWYLDGSVPDDDSEDDDGIDISGFETALTALEISEFTNDVTDGKLEISVTAKLSLDGEPQVTMEFYRLDGEYCVAVVDGETIGTVARADVVSLVEAVNALVL